MLFLIPVAAALLAGGWAVEKASQAGLTPTSQTTVPEVKGTLAQNADKLGSAASLGLLLVSGAFAYSLVKR